MCVADRRLSISGARLTRELDRLADRRRLPKTIVCDHGSELTCKAMFFWAKRTGVRLHLIQPGKPTQNAFVESVNAKFREYCLDLNWFSGLEDARSTIDSSRNHYNHVRPHRSLGKSHLRCSPRKPPDRLNLPHQPWPQLRGTLTPDPTQNGPGSA